MKIKDKRSLNYAHKAIAKLDALLKVYNKELYCDADCNIDDVITIDEALLTVSDKIIAVKCIIQNAIGECK